MATVLSAVLLGASLVGGAAAAPRQPRSGAPSDESCPQVRVQRNVSVPMRDGTKLKADVYRPVTNDKVPAVVMRTQYGKNAPQDEPLRFSSPKEYAQYCYLMVVQDVRGQFQSPGDFYEFAHEQRDGYDTVEWAARLPGSNGNVGMWGSSYVGATQWLAAEAAPPHLKAIAPFNTASDYYNNWTYQDGAFSQAFEQSWAMGTIARSRAAHEGNWRLVKQLGRATQPAHLARWYRFLPLKQFPPLHPNDPRVAGWFYDWLDHNTDDGYWKQWNPNSHYDDVKVPSLNVDGWYDLFASGAVQNFTGMRDHGGSVVARDNQQLVLGPYTHTNWGSQQPWGPQGAPQDRLPVSDPHNTNYGPQAALATDKLLLDWWDHWLKGVPNGVTSHAPVRYFLMGANQWKTAQNWPVPGTRWRDYYLSSGGHANTRHGDGTLTGQSSAGTDGYTYDPRNPVPSKGGHSCCEPEVDPLGPADQRQVEDRGDVLVYDTPALPRDMEVTGPVTVTLHAASSARDTDFTAKLVDVAPDGTTTNLGDGIVRAWFRDSLTQPSLIQPGKPYQYRIKVQPTSNLFRAGHRIRLEISSSNFPMYDRNPNTGHPFGQDALTQPAHQTVYHDAQHPSHLTLPVIPAGQ